MDRRSFLTFPLAGLVLGAVVSAKPAQATPVLRRRAIELAWFVQPPGPSYSNPLNIGRKVGLRWREQSAGLWGVIAFYDISHSQAIPRRHMDIIRHQLLLRLKAWERGVSDYTIHSLTEGYPYDSVAVCVWETGEVRNLGRSDFV